METLSIKDINMKDLRKEIKRREDIMKRPEMKIDTDIPMSLAEEAYEICEEYIDKVESDKFLLGYGDKLLQRSIEIIYGEEAIEWLKYKILQNKEDREK